MEPKRYIEFLKHGIWRIKIDGLPPAKRIGIIILRVLVLTFRGMMEDRWQQRASSLTYYTVMSVVPALAMVFGIAKGFGFAEALQSVLMEMFQGQVEVVTKVVEFANRLLENVKGGLMAITGFLVLFWAVFRLLSQIESAFNGIWGIKHPRRLSRKITDYLAIMLVSPFFLLISSTISVLINDSFKGLVEKVSIFAAMSPFVFLLLKLVPFLIIWLLFTFLYSFMPNTRIKLLPAAIAAVVSGTIFQIFQGLYIYFQVRISNYNAIYGSFAALPLFFIWLQTSWFIVLFGAELTSAHQNIENYEMETDRQDISLSFRKLLSLYLIHSLIRDFMKGEHPSNQELAQEVEIPVPVVNMLLSELEEAELIGKIKSDKDDTPRYQPACDPENLTILSVLRKMENKGHSLPLPDSEALDRLRSSLDSLGQIMQTSPANTRLKDLSR